jgi:hypothetical protein
MLPCSSCRHHAHKQEARSIDGSTTHSCRRQEFLATRRGSSADCPESGSSGRCQADNKQTKPGVPRRDEKPVMGLVSQKNYITVNDVNNILAVPKNPVSTDVNYLQKQDYGRVPQYLSSVKEQIAEEYKTIEVMTQSNQPQNMKTKLKC